MKDIEVYVQIKLKVSLGETILFKNYLQKLFLNRTLLAKSVGSWYKVSFIMNKSIQCQNIINCHLKNVMLKKKEISTAIVAATQIWLLPS